jgi:YHS domain-containing protein
LTRNGIEYDLPQSPYKIKIGNITYFFSSDKHLDKFIDMYDDNQYNMQNSLFKRFKFNVDIEPVYALFFYKKIETRGFYIEFDGRGYTCLSNITLNGDRLIIR